MDFLKQVEEFTLRTPQVLLDYEPTYKTTLDGRKKKTLSFPDYLIPVGEEGDLEDSSAGSTCNPLSTLSGLSDFEMSRRVFEGEDLLARPMKKSSASRLLLQRQSHHTLRLVFLLLELFWVL